MAKKQRRTLGQSDESDLALSGQPAVSTEIQLRWDGYSAIEDDAIRQEVIEAVLDIQSRRKRQFSNIVGIGNLLNRMKMLIPHKGFQPWADAEFGFSKQTRINYMNLARHLSKFPTPEFFDISGLYELAAYIERRDGDKSILTDVLETTKEGRVDKETMLKLINTHNALPVTEINGEETVVEDEPIIQIQPPTIIMFKTGSVESEWSDYSGEIRLKRGRGYVNTTVEDLRAIINEYDQRQSDVGDFGD